jgi:molecular chaperone GrpE|tara:strand:- start:1615 stop:2220 length:606 start_codon:yes stop_codon:yes gene_type:complete
MEKEQNSKIEENINDKSVTSEQSKDDEKSKEEKVELTPEDKIKELEEKLTRTLAEMENQRRRFEKEKDDAFEYGGFSFARESLNLIDNFDRARQSLENDEKIKNSDLLQKVLDHLDVIKKDLISIFKKNNIEEIIAVDKKLDPNLHQAMMEVEDDNKEPGTIVQEIQKGFKMKDRLLRPSLVAVSKKTEKKEEKIEEKAKK